MNLEGRWFNELGSEMNLTVKGKIISGTYHTRVGDAVGVYELTGQTDIDVDESQAIGFVVVWNNNSGSSDSVTTWSGQARIVNGVETIVTTWLLTVETESDDEWHSTIINKDVFTRTPPSAEMIKEHISKGFKESFPKSVKNNLL